MHEKKRRQPALLASAYPNLSEKERQEASENLRRYLEVCIRQWERLERERKNDTWGQPD